MFLWDLWVVWWFTVGLVDFFQLIYSDDNKRNKNVSAFLLKYTVMQIYINTFCMFWLLFATATDHCHLNPFAIIVHPSLFHQIDWYNLFYQSSYVIKVTFQGLLNTCQTRVEIFCDSLTSNTLDKASWYQNEKRGTCASLTEISEIGDYVERRAWHLIQTSRLKPGSAVDLRVHRNVWDPEKVPT